MSNGPEDSRGRWWEIRGEGEPEEGGHRELMTDSRGRSRPERSLSGGADLAEDVGHRSRALLWPIVSAVAAVGLILSVVYVSKDKSTSPASAMPPEPAVRGSAPPGDMGVKQGPEVKQDPGIKPVGPPARWGNVPVPDGGAPPPIGGQARTPRGADAISGSPVGAPNEKSGGAVGDNRGQPPGTPASSTPLSAPPPAPTLPVLYGPAPPAPEPQRGKRLVSGTGGCEPYNTRVYACTIAHDAPIYLAGTRDRDPSGPRLAGYRYAFLCQSYGSKYVVGDRASHWWAWTWARNSDEGAWVPVVLMVDGPDNGPEPGLPVCDSGPTSTTTPSPASAGGTSTSTTTTPPTTSASSAPTTTTTPTI